MPIRNILVLTFLALSVAILVFIFSKAPDVKPIPTELLAVLKPHPKQLNEISLTDHNNNSFTIEQLKNTNTLLFFGYTSCPDICPTALSTMNLVYKKLKQEASFEKLNVVFVSVDPARDKLNQLADYVKYFNNDFVGVSGTKNNIDQVTKQFSAAYMFEENTSDENYLVSHTSSIFLVNPDAKIIGSFSPPHHVDVIVSQLKMILKI